MKTIKIIFLLLLFATCAYGAAGDVASVGGKAVTAISTIDGKAGSGVATLCGKNYTDGDTATKAYFGYQTSKDDPGAVSWDTATTQVSASKASLWTYGGTTGTLTDLCVWAKSGGSTAKNIRLAIYSNDGNSLLAEWTSEVSVSSTTASFVCSPGLSASPTITNGTAYRLVQAVDGADVNVGYTTGSSGDFLYAGTDATGGYSGYANLSGLVTASTRKRVIIGEVTP